MMTENSRSTRTKPTSLPYDRRFGVVAYGLLLLIILFSTYLHHLQPQVLRVPDNGDPAAWHNPALDETVLVERMTDTEKMQFLEEGVPFGEDLPAQFAADLFTILLGWICFLHARRHFGFWMASCFLIGSFVFTGLEETLWILSGRFLGGMVNNPLGETVTGAYWFTRGGCWFLETPVVACLGWFFIAYSCVLTAGKVFPRMGLWGRAFVGAMIAVGVDLWMDPIQTAPEIMAWVWGRGDVLYLFGIPHYNFLGWFLLIFLFAVLWEKLPQMEDRWGRPRATIRFVSIILTLPFGILFCLWAWIYGVGLAFSLAGLEHAVSIPAGW